MQRRAFNQLPEHLKTEQNNREFYIADDPLYEPEASKFITGYIGDSSILTEEDLRRTPMLAELDAVRQKYQLGIGVAYVDPETDEYLSGAFYPDLIRHLAINGAITDDPNRLFGAKYYAWNPPIDYDRHINFARYFWIGEGDATTRGEYITKEVAGSQTCVHRFDGTEFVRESVRIVNGLPASGTTGEIVEDASNSGRLIYVWNGSVWTLLNFRVIADTTDTRGFQSGDYAYVGRTGPNFNRPLLWVYKETAGRWIATPVVVNVTQPDTPRVGMVWEDTTALPDRVFRIYGENGWVPLTWTAADGPAGRPAHNTYIYDIRDLSEITDGWSRNNWWRAYEDLSASDRAYLAAETQAVRPIIEFWGNLEGVDGDSRDDRNDAPVFAVYAYSKAAGEIVAVNPTNFPGASGEIGSTIYSYAEGAGNPDTVLSFPVTFNERGEFQFDLTLETQEIPLSSGDLLGYRMFRDAATGLVHSIWSRSTANLAQTADANGLYDLPRNLTSNPDHEVLTDPSRTKLLTHFSNVISAQESFSGDQFGANSYRYSDQDPTRGATIIDPEASLLRGMALLQSAKLDLPETIRQIAREYNKVMFRFFNKMRQLWESGDIASPEDTLVVSASDAVNAILTEIFIGRSEEFPFYNSDMGEFVETRIIAGVANVVDPSAKPIMIAPSAARIGMSPTFQPEIFIDGDGVKKIRGHDGSLVPAFNDDRDQIVLELENRFFAAVPASRKTESESFSARYNPAGFALADYYDNFAPAATAAPVDAVVADYTVEAPVAGRRVFSANFTVYAISDGAKWFTEPAKADDVFLNRENGSYYIFNGFYANPIPAFNKSVTFDYSDNEYRTILRRDFERFIVGLNADFTANTTFSLNDPFTWNYRSAGVEGNWRGIYRRVYRTVRPHSHPWEVAGYSIRPTWWFSQYVPTSYAADGTPRYARSHPMWADLQSGLVNPITGSPDPRLAMVAPIPVGANGNLLNPIDAGIVAETNLDMQTIDDDWVYGDGADVEQSFYESYYHQFAVALASYLMKPATVVETMWTDFYQTIGVTGTNTLWRAPHIVNKDILTRPRVADVPLHLTTAADGTKVENIGLNAWIAERVALNGGSVDLDFARVLTNSTPSLGWRTSTFINSKRTVVEPVTGKEIPFEDVHVVLHQTPAVLQTFASGMVIVREGAGFRVFGYDSVNPRFRVDTGAVPSVGGQVEFRQQFTATSGQTEFTITENFNLPQQNDTARFGVVVNGFRVEDKYVHVTGLKTFEIDPNFTIRAGDVVIASVITAISNPSTQVRSFVVRNHRFDYYATPSGETIDYEYGHFFETVTDVVNMMVGYGRYLTRQGWVFDQQDGGQVIDWLYGAKVFANWAVSTAEQAGGDTQTLEASQFFFSPIAAQATISVDFGHILNLESIRNGTYGVISRDGLPMRPADTFVSRLDGSLTVKNVNPDREIYGVRVYLTEIMHAVFFSNKTRFNDLIYDPVLAVYHTVMRVDSYGVANWNGRLEAPGHIISRGELLPNFEKQVFDFTRLYSRTNPVDDPETRDQARALYGYEPKSYMDIIDADDRIKFDHHIGLKFTKGTMRAFKAFVRGTRIGTEHVQIRENWGWKLAEYGDMRSESVMFRVNKVDFRNQRQVIKFADALDSTGEYIIVTPFERPQNLTSDPPTHPRWIVPPQKSSYTATQNFEIAVTDDNESDLDAYNFSCRVINLANNEIISTPFHWEPQRGRHEPEAWSKIDVYSSIDPARYNKGPEAANSGPNVWGDEQVGTLWLDASKLIYADARARFPDSNQVAREWGRLKYLRGLITRTNEVVTVSTVDPFTGTAAAHGLATGDTVTISGADQDEYNQSDVEVTVTSATAFTFITNDQPASPATGNITVQIGDCRVYEWVEAPVRPDQWATYIEGLTGPDRYTGEVLDPDNASYVEVVSRDGNNREVSTYYFWVRGNTRMNPEKMMTTFDVENRLRDPQTYGLSFFAPMTRSQMFVFPSGDRVLDNYAIQITQDKRELNTHIEWLLIGENSGFRELPTEMSVKVVDSLCGETASGEPVPNPTLAETERYGNLYYPAQTVFRDREKAVKVYIEAMNRLVETTVLESLDPIVSVLELADEKSDSNPDGYWTRDTYRDSSIVGKAVYDTVLTIAERDLRASRKLYAAGDLVLVRQSDRTDLWSGDQVGAIYRYDGSAWTEVGIEKNSFRLNDNLINNPVAHRAIINAFKRTQSLSLSERNGLMFSVLYEMLRQNPFCDWFIKTSYLNVQIEQTIEKSPYVRVSEADAIFSHILDTKAFRTKLRNEIVTGRVGEVENFNVELIELPAQRVTLLFDRLSCNLIDDGGWDGRPWAAWDDKEWDLPIWHYDDLGRQFYREVATFTPTGTQTEFIATVTSGTPFLFNVTTKLIYDGEEVDPADLGVTITVERFTKSVRVTLSTPLSNQYTIKLLMAQGFYDGPEPSLGDDVNDEYPDMVATPSSYEHHVARLLQPGVYNPCSEMLGCEGGGCNDDFGGDAEERVKSEVYDTANIVVTTEHTAAYEGWDTTPWDTVPWDSGPPDVGSRTFIVLAGREPEIPAGIEIFTTSEDFAKPDSPYVLASSQICGIAQVYFDIGSGYTLKTEGTHYRFVEPFRHIIEVLEAPDVTFTSNGLQQTYTFSQIEVGIDRVYRNNALLQPNIDYIVTGTNTITLMGILVSGDVYRIVQRPYIATGDNIRFVFDRFNLGVNRGFTVLSYPGLYSIDGTTLVFDEVPAANQTLTVRYDVTRLDANPRGVVVRMATLIDDVTADRSEYDAPGFDDTRQVGHTVADTSDDNFYEWNGTAWTLVGPVGVGDPFFVKRQQSVTFFNGSSYITLWAPGESYSRPPVLEEPAFGAGITWGTLSFGTMPSAATDFPDAYEVVQHAGGYDD